MFKDDLINTKPVPRVDAVVVVVVNVVVVVVVGVVVDVVVIVVVDVVVNTFPVTCAGSWAAVIESVEVGAPPRASWGHNR